MTFIFVWFAILYISTLGYVQLRPLLDEDTALHCTCPAAAPAWSGNSWRVRPRGQQLDEPEEENADAHTCRAYSQNWLGSSTQQKPAEDAWELPLADSADYDQSADETYDAGDEEELSLDGVEESDEAEQASAAELEKDDVEEADDMDAAEEAAETQQLEDEQAGEMADTPDAEVSITVSENDDVNEQPLLSEDGSKRAIGSAQSEPPAASDKDEITAGIEKIEFDEAHQFEEFLQSFQALNHRAGSSEQKRNEQLHSIPIWRDSDAKLASSVADEAAEKGGDGAAAVASEASKPSGAARAAAKPVAATTRHKTETTNAELSKVLEEIQRNNEAVQRMLSKTQKKRGEDSAPDTHVQQKDARVSQQYATVMRQSQKLEKQKQAQDLIGKPRTAAEAFSAGAEQEGAAASKQRNHMQNRKTDMQFEVAKAVNNVIDELQPTEEQTDAEDEWNEEGDPGEALPSDAKGDGDFTHYKNKAKYAEQRETQGGERKEDKDMMKRKETPEIKVHISMPELAPGSDGDKAKDASGGGWYTVEPTLHSKYLERVAQDNDRLQQQQVTHGYHNLDEIAQLLEREYAILQSFKRSQQGAADEGGRQQKPLANAQLHEDAKESAADREMPAKASPHAKPKERKVVEKFLEDFEEHDRRVQQEIEKAVKSVIVNMKDDQKKVKLKHLETLDPTAEERLMGERGEDKPKVEQRQESRPKEAAKSVAALAAPMAAASKAPAAPLAGAAVKPQSDSLLDFLSFIGQNKKIREEYAEFDRAQKEQSAPAIGQAAAKKPAQATPVAGLFGKLRSFFRWATNGENGSPVASSGSTAIAGAPPLSTNMAHGSSRPLSGGGSSTSSSNAAQIGAAVEAVVQQDDPAIKSAVDKAMKHVFHDLQQQQTESQLALNAATAQAAKEKEVAAAQSRIWDELLPEKRFPYKGLSDWRWQENMDEDSDADIAAESVYNADRTTASDSSWLDGDQYSYNYNENEDAAGEQTDTSASDQMERLQHSYERNRDVIELLRNKQLLKRRQATRMPPVDDGGA